MQLLLVTFFTNFVEISFDHPSHTGGLFAHFTQADASGSNASSTGLNTSSTGSLSQSQQAFLVGSPSTLSSSSLGSPPGSLNGSHGMHTTGLNTSGFNLGRFCHTYMGDTMWCALRAQISRKPPRPLPCSVEVLPLCPQICVFLCLGVTRLEKRIWSKIATKMWLSYKCS